MSKERELLRRALEALHFDLSAKESAKVAEEIRDYLATEPEAEPVAWYHPSGDGYDSNFRDHEVVKACTGNPWTGWIPLYTRPDPARKPMTEEEIEDIYYSGLTFENTYLSAFVEGFRQAEKHHGIGVSDE